MVDIGFGKRALQNGVNVAVFTGKVIVVNTEVIHMFHLYCIQLRRLQHMVAMEPDVLDAIGGVKLELPNAVDFIVHYIQACDLIETTERVFFNNSQVGLLYAKIMHLRQPPEGVRLHNFQIHVGNLEKPHALKTRESVRFNELDAGRQNQMLNVRQTGEGMTLNAVKWVVVEEQQTHVSGACEGELFNLVDFVVIQQQDAHILKTCKRKGRYRPQMCVLNGQLA